MRRWTFPACSTWRCCPGDIHQIVPAGSIGGIRVNQVFIGGCAGGTLEALRLTAEIWRGRKVCPYVRVMVAPATASVYVQALDEGVIDVFLVPERL